MFGTRIGRMIVVAGGPKLPRVTGELIWRPLSERSAAELRTQAAEYRRMAEDATTMQVVNGLSRLAERLDAMADLREREEAGKA